MSKAINSPTARILRSSRLFCLPPHLPQATIEIPAYQGKVLHSDSATLPYPTVQAIASPAASRSRGDWGLKRPLPTKINRTSTPHVRIHKLDTLEHITDFDSAADHTVTLRKWQEMNIQMVEREKDTPGRGSYKIALPSAFDRDTDNTTSSRQISQNQTPIERLPLSVDKAMKNRELQSKLKSSGDGYVRWKTDGPYLPIMSQISFDNYVRKVVEQPKTQQEFRKFVLDEWREKKKTEARKKMTNERGFDPDDEQDIKALEKEAEIRDPEAETDQYLLSLRDRHSNLSSELSRLIQTFFDLPRYPSSSGNYPSVGIDGPSPIHASAGLSYIRSNAYMNNNPTHGPQMMHEPIQVRLLKPKASLRGGSKDALVGVGGVVAAFKSEQAYESSNKTKSIGSVQNWDFDIPGGSKIWAEPRTAYIDEHGRIRLTVVEPQKETLTVRKDEPDFRRPPDDWVGALRKQIIADNSFIPNTAPPGTAENANYGAALPGLRRMEPLMPLGKKEIQSFKDSIGKSKLDSSSNAGESLLQALTPK